MKRTTVHLAAIALAAGISVAEMAAIATLADSLLAPDEAVAQLPRVVVTPVETRVDSTADVSHETLARAAPFPAR